MPAAHHSKLARIAAALGAHWGGGRSARRRSTPPPGDGSPPLVPAGHRLVRVVRIHAEAAGVKSFLLVPEDGRPLTQPTAGAHIDVHAAPGVVRQYALCNGPDDQLGYVIAVRRDSASRGGSRTLCDRIKVGDLLVISDPRSHFSLHVGASRHLLLAQGIGVAPILAMGRALAATDAEFRIDYFARSAEHAPFRGQILTPPLASHARFYPGLEPDQQADIVAQVLSEPREGTHVYICGTREFMDAALQAAAGWPADAVHCEYFHANPAAWASERRAFDVRLARRNLTLHVPAELTLSDALAQAGVPLATPCGQGVCGRCAVCVLAGRPDHRDAVLTPLERERGQRIMACVSRALDPELILDL